jgi:hypothetical protein
MRESSCGDSREKGVKELAKRGPKNGREGGQNARDEWAKSAQPDPHFSDRHGRGYHVGGATKC